MFIKVLRAKIHRATTTAADLDYVGSITIDRELMDAVGLVEGECVLVANLANGTRHETYVIPGEPGGREAGPAFGRADHHGVCLHLTRAGGNAEAQVPVGRS